MAPPIKLWISAATSCDVNRNIGKLVWQCKRKVRRFYIPLSLYLQEQSVRDWLFIDACISLNLFKFWKMLKSKSWSKENKFREILRLSKFFCTAVSGQCLEVWLFFSTKPKLLSSTRIFQNFLGIFLTSYPSEDIGQEVSIWHNWSWIF